MRQTFDMGSMFKVRVEALCVHMCCFGKLAPAGAHGVLDTRCNAGIPSYSFICFGLGHITFVVAVMR